MRAGAVRARPIDLLEDRGGIADAEPGPAVLGRDERAKPPGVGQRPHEAFWIRADAVELAPILVAERRAELADRRSKLLAVRARREVHQSFGEGKCERSGPFAFVGIMNVRVMTRTIVPSCLMPRCLTFTTPHPGRERVSRTSTTCVSA